MGRSLPANIRLLWRDPAAARGVRTGVCLHGHTLHSEECLSFLPRHLRQVPGVSRIVRRYEKTGVDFARAYWTPPLPPAAALALERGQIERLALRPLVSLTDHDKLEACLALQVAADRDEVPVSVEWTVPYERTILHLGIHNLPRAERSWMAAMAAYTTAPDAARLPELLRELSAFPELLVVLNHPFWLEEGVEEAAHAPALHRLFRECLPWIHAFELNGTRPWKENADTIELAQAHRRPVISGGDRHACEPGACLNLTNAQSFSEFAAEVRQGRSTLLFMPQYREPMPLRILEASWDILRPFPEYPGRERWTDRVFYRGDDGAPRPLSLIWKHRVPPILAAAAGLVQAVATTRLRWAIRPLVTERGEVLP